MDDYENTLCCMEAEQDIIWTKGYLYNIYDDGGEFVIGFYEPEEEDFYELYSGQDGEVHYVRSDHCTGGTGTANPNQTAHQFRYLFDARQIKTYNSPDVCI